MNECESNSASAFGPCINAESCRNYPGSFECVCQSGWAGKTCSKNIDDCQGKCENGATCIDLVNDYYCTCPIGFAGKWQPVILKLETEVNFSFFVFLKVKIVQKI